MSEKVLPFADQPVEDPFRDIHDFFDEVHGQVLLSQLERDVIDTPEFQRLFRVSQLGFVDLVHQCATHTRGIHSIGACVMAKRLVRRLNENTPRIHEQWCRAGNHDRPAPPTISQSETVVVGLAGLLHDVSHGPYSHDIEKKTHYVPRPQGPPLRVKSYYGPYEKHDDFTQNPALYVILFDILVSVVARVLQHYSPAFWALVQRESRSGDFPHLDRFSRAVADAGWTTVAKDVLPALLFHLLVFEDEKQAGRSSISLKTSFDARADSEWGLGPRPSWAALHRIWYQPFRHDIVGNTLNADLLDYLQRDPCHLGMGKGVDWTLLDLYTLVEVDTPALDERDPASKRHPVAPGRAVNARYRCAMDLNDYKRGTVRSERLNDVFRLLDLRHEIHEKAVFHRVVQSAVAMLSRSVLMLGDSRPKPKEFYGLGDTATALCGEDEFLRLILAASNRPANKDGAVDPAGAQSIAQKLVERRVYRPLMIVPGDRIQTLLQGLYTINSENRENVLRALAAIVDSPYFAPFFCFVSWCIEKLLEHALDSEEAVNGFLETVAEDDRRLRWAEALPPPKRVIFWTTPYKQLYKDPALLVRVGDRVGTIEALQNEPSLGARITAGMSDAERKYENLWKLYVFLSDGLFYTGVLAKLIEGHRCNGDPRAHGAHLEQARDLVIRAVRRAWDCWDASKGTLALGTPMNREVLKEQLRVLASEWYSYRSRRAEILPRVSAVAVDQYLHGDPPVNCRDVRYKFDLRDQWNATITGLGLDARERGRIEQILRATKIALEDLGKEEIIEICARLGRVPEAVLKGLEARAARAEPLIPGKLLQALWRREPNWDSEWT